MEQMERYKVAGIDVHKKMLAVAVADVAGVGEYEFQLRRLGTGAEELRALANWLVEQQVEEVVMESTAQYWKPVWAALEQYWQPVRRQKPEAVAKLHLAQAKSNRAPSGRKNDWLDAKRLVKRLVAQELILSFVPDPEQRLWRTVTRRKHQLTRDRVRLQNQLESLLEEAHIKLSSWVSDLLGQSARRMLSALAEGEADPMVLAAMGDRNLKATPEQLCNALGAVRHLSPAYRQILKMLLEQLQLIEKHRAQLDQEASALLQAHHEALKRLAEMPGLGADSAQQIIAEVGPAAARFSSAKHLASWVGACPGEQESAGESQSSRSPKGNRTLRRVLNQAAHAAVKVKGSIFHVVFQRMLRVMDYKKAIWAIAHRICRLVWKLLHQGVSYEERGPAVNAKAQRIRATKMIRQLRRMGYDIQPLPEHA